MGTLAQEVSALEERREALAKQLAEVTAQLDGIQAALGQSQAAVRTVVGSAAPPRAKSAQKGKTNGAARRTWFEPGEALALAQKILRKPMRPADLVRALGEAKGYGGRLSKEDLNRFQFAAYAAIKHAVGTNKLSKAKDGSISVRK